MPAGKHGRPATVFVGLTGGIGSGKSEALRLLSELGAETISTDAVVHELLAEPELRDLLVEHFGEAVAPGGEVDRAAVGASVFDDPDELRWLEGVLHPRVRARIAAWREELERRPQPPALAAVEVPLLFETGLEGGFDTTVAVVTAEPVRAERAAARGHTGLEGRSERQLSPAEKAARADHVVSNDGSLEDLRAELAALVEELTSARAGARA